MIEINVCIGSACHLKGSYDVIKRFQSIIDEKKLGDEVTVKAAFCLGDCMKAVAVRINEEEKMHSLNTKNADGFFAEYVQKKVN
ncbi:MAG: (2Fe-2S) ferredoxin domain-containing protein [Alkaliphilus sp.]